MNVLRRMIVGDGGAPAPSKFDWSNVNKAVEAIDPILQTSLTAAGLPTKPKNPQPVRKPPHQSIPWSTIIGYGAAAAAGVGIIVVLLRSGRRR